MRFIDIDLDGVRVRAALSDARAPVTCEAIWNALPFEGRAVHAQTSGEMFRMLDPVPVGDLEVEHGVAFQHPGEVVFYPPLKEIAFCIGPARFRGTAGPEYVTSVAEVEGDLAEWTRAGTALQFTGARPIRFTRARDQVSPFRVPELSGRKIEVTLGDVVQRATLLEDAAPRTIEALIRVLPLVGEATNTKWSGEVTRFWGPRGPRREVPIDIDFAESPQTLHWPGYIYYYPEWRGIRICYGPGNMMGAWGPAVLTPIARFDGDWSAFRAKAASQLTEGVMPMSIRLVG